MKYVQRYLMPILTSFKHKIGLDYNVEQLTELQRSWLEGFHFPVTIQGPKQEEVLETHILWSKVEELLERFKITSTSLKGITSEGTVGR